MSFVLDSACLEPRRRPKSRDRSWALSGPPSLAKQTAPSTMPAARPGVSALRPSSRSRRRGCERSAPNSHVTAMWTRRWTTLFAFLNDGRTCLTDNAAKRALCGIALGRKSWLFAGSDRGGERAAVMLTLIQTAKPIAWWIQHKRCQQAGLVDERIKIAPAPRVTRRLACAREANAGVRPDRAKGAERGPGAYSSFIPTAFWSDCGAHSGTGARRSHA